MYHIWISLKCWELYSREMSLKKHSRLIELMLKAERWLDLLKWIVTCVCHTCVGSTLGYPPCSPLLNAFVQAAAPELIIGKTGDLTALLYFSSLWACHQKGPLGLLFEGYSKGVFFTLYLSQAAEY